MVLSVLMMVLGAAGAIVGTALVYRSPDIGQGLTNVPLPVAVLVFGVIMFFLSFLGTWSSMHHRKREFAVFLLLTALTFAAVVSVTITAKWYQDRLRDKLQAGWHKSSDGTRSNLQNIHNCCGFLTNQDYPGSSCGPAQNINPAIPPCVEYIVDRARDKMSLFIITGVVVSSFLGVVLGTAIPFFNILNSSKVYKPSAGAAAQAQARG
ncbi:uncharacterized protein AMSG_03296 [Thecamonas trahens ATCC 50062]|uniref:Tetraspanin n=1 Tax=Thecamonas trahens ATCC 50062 TaxID=461836 RepID=A0A0L0D3Q2_THETB|nr:hypothetical protein AMSG_03296 [Thecamonas trahens ATCC 50062]KNC46865.1 hypothetical protein AMSG_03296 [Thecamonas trahens ATCC 50062]|eukprot:XP_013760138.1 hypothetical protein AMSG_03296 [Thecamonas trahens ATCC 50062]